MQAILSDGEPGNGFVWLRIYIEGLVFASQPTVQVFLLYITNARCRCPFQVKFFPCKVSLVQWDYLSPDAKCYKYK